MSALIPCSAPIVSKKGKPSLLLSTIWITKQKKSLLRDNGNAVISISINFQPMTQISSLKISMKMEIVPGFNPSAGN